jgi:nitrite reductase/ring-hydroxylating ferredoxin subunit
MKKARNIFLLLLTSWLTLYNCDNERYQIVPYVPVSFTINLNIWNDLTVPGNSVYFDGPGYAGVIIYCEYPGSYYAFDAACTHEISIDCKITCDGVMATCPCCGSQFVLLSGGNPIKAPATKPLQPYHISVTNNLLRVYN